LPENIVLIVIPGAHGRQQGRGKRAFPPLEIGTKKQKFLENVKSAF